MVTERLAVADIVGVYGIKGWVRIRPLLEDPTVLTQLQDLQLQLPGPAGKHVPPRAVTLATLQRQGRGWVASLDVVVDRTAAEALKGGQLTVAAGQLPPAEAGEYFWRDLVGLLVWCDEAGTRNCLGRVDYLLETGANDVLVVRPTPESIDDRERLIPWLPERVVTRVDLDAGELWVDWFVDA